MSEPDPDEADTGPLHIPAPPVDDDRDAPRETRSLPHGGLPGDARLYTGNDPDWPRRFEPLTVDPQPVRTQRTRILQMAAIGLALVVVVSGVIFWMLQPSSPEPSSTADDSGVSTTTASPPVDPEDQAKLLELLPAGYPSDSCDAVAPTEGALAQVNCDRNGDPGGPLSATYTLASGKAALDVAFDDIVGASTTVNCPGNIQSPGPWRSNSTPHKTSGVLFCGVQEGRPTVAWTNDDDLLVSTVQSGLQGPTLDQMYAWWSSHS